MSPQQVCPEHGVEFAWVPPGISKKNGKPYQGFHACPVRGCRERPAIEARPVAAAPAVQPKKQPDWDAIAIGKVRHGIVCALIQAGRSADAIYSEAPDLVGFVMTGAAPDHSMGGVGDGEDFGF